MLRNGNSGNLQGMAMSYDDEVATLILFSGMAMSYDDTAKGPLA
jgi:hypothetical protein